MERINIDPLPSHSIVLLILSRAFLLILSRATPSVTFHTQAKLSGPFALMVKNVLKAWRGAQVVEGTEKYTDFDEKDFNIPW